MAKINLDVLKNRIADMYDPDDLVDLLGISVADLLDAFEERVINNMEIWEDLDIDVNDE